MDKRWTNDDKVFKEITHKHYDDIENIMERIEHIYQFYSSVASNKKENELKVKLKKTLNDLYNISILLKTNEKTDLNKYIL